jgi:hypothetical protein
MAHEHEHTLLYCFEARGNQYDVNQVFNTRVCKSYQLLR